MAKSRKNPDALYWQLMADFEQKLIESALTTHKGKVKAAARMLGLSWPYLYKRMVALGMREPPKTATRKDPLPPLEDDTDPEVPETTSPDPEPSP